MSDRTLGRRIRVYGVGVVVLAVIGSAALGRGGSVPPAAEDVVTHAVAVPVEPLVRSAW